jgi:hypothetical protein
LNPLVHIGASRRASYYAERNPAGHDLLSADGVGRTEQQEDLM